MNQQRNSVGRVHHKKLIIGELGNNSLVHSETRRFKNSPHTLPYPEPVKSSPHAGP